VKTSQFIQQCNKKELMLISAGLYSNGIRILELLVISDEQLEEGIDVLRRGHHKLILGYQNYWGSEIVEEEVFY
jgi:4-aminobutyrate aminotransferase-like enzyme